MQHAASCQQADNTACLPPTLSMPPLIITTRFPPPTQPAPTHPTRPPRQQVVFLDEPTTGLDPVSRRHLWDLIDSAKRGRAVVLTTHSMEEADILGDR